MSSKPPRPPRVNEDELLGVLWAGIAIGLIGIICRALIRLRVFKRLWVEDGFLLLGWLSALAYVIIWQLRAKDVYFAATQRIDLPHFMRSLENANHAVFISQWLLYTSLYLIKLSFLFFFRRLQGTAKRQKIIWWIVFGFTVAAYPATVAVINWNCFFAPQSEIIAKCLLPSVRPRQFFTIRFAAALDVVTDAAIICVPIEILWKVQIDLRKKLALGAIFSLTAFVIAVAIARAAVVTSLGGLAIDMPLIAFLGGLEVTVAVVIACLVSFRALFTRPDRKFRPLHGNHHQGEMKPLKYITPTRENVSGQTPKISNMTPNQENNSRQTVNTMV